MASRSFSSTDAQEMSYSQSGGSAAVAQPVEATESQEKQTYGSSSESGSESSVGGNWGTEGMDLDESLQAEFPRNENILLTVRTAQSTRDDLEQELNFQQSRLVSADEQNLMAHPLNMEKALGISTRLSGCTKVMAERIKKSENQNETELHDATMARKAAEIAAKEAQSQLEMLKSEHGETLLSMQSEYKDRLRGLHAELTVEKIKSDTTERSLKEVECQLLAKRDANTELETKVRNMESRMKDLEIMKSLAERRLQGEPKRRKMAVKAALDSAAAKLARKADSFGKKYLKSALDILKRQYPNLDFSMIENGDRLMGASDNMDIIDPQPSRIAPNPAEDKVPTP